MDTGYRWELLCVYVDAHTTQETDGRSGRRISPHSFRATPSIFERENDLNVFFFLRKHDMGDVDMVHMKFIRTVGQ